MWGLVWEEQVDVGGCPAVSRKALGRLLYLPASVEEGVGIGEVRGLRL